MGELYKLEDSHSWRIKGLYAENAAMKDELSRLRAERNRLLKFIEGIATNYDCDSDGHKYGTHCRCCEAYTLLAAIEAVRGGKQ